MANRVLQTKRVKINNFRRRRKGKMTTKEILKDRVKEYNQAYPKTGYRASVKGMAVFNSQPGTLFRTRDGSIFLAKDKLDEYFATKFAKRYTDADIEALGKPNAEGWITANSTPLAAVKEKLRRLAGEDDIQKWIHFAVRRDPHIHIDLFCSPKKDKWFYIQLNPLTGESQRSNIIGSKNVAEMKRLQKKLTWIDLNTKIIPI